jgi:two-component system, OmpR family, alkaline phosphatase synthesis response regulator PhoP
MSTPKILVVDDEPPIADLIASYLRADGFNVTTAFDGSTAVAQALSIQPDLIVLDVMLPGLDGLEVCRRVQQEFEVYVLMLTARTEEIDKLVGLSIGADDYMTKPFSPRELVLRVKAILRRNRTREWGMETLDSPKRSILHFEELVIDPVTHEVWRNGQQVDLTVREFDLLYTLAEQPGRVFSRDQLLEQVWGRNFIGIDRVVDPHIVALRRKLADDANTPMIIQTVRGVGYKFIGRRNGEVGTVKPELSHPLD